MKEHKYITNPRCEEINPTTSNRCTMGKGHSSKCRVGDVYYPTEMWVVKCAGDNGSIMGNIEGCVYHEAWYKNRKLVPEYLKCIRCGHEKEII